MSEKAANPIEAQPDNDAERLILQAAFAGKWAEFVRPPDGGRCVRVRAVFLRHLLSDVAQSASPWGRSGLRVRGVHIEGRIDLADWTGTGGIALPPLLFDNCEIPGVIDVSHAHLARLSITNSHISHIHADGVRIDGPFDFSGLRAYCAPQTSEEESVAWIDGRGARIAGDLIGRGAQLKAPKPRPAKDLSRDDKRRYGLGLQNSEIHGRVILRNGFSAQGGVNLGGSYVTGEVWLRGAKLSAGEDDALNGQNARFQSALILDDGFVADGQVWLLGAQMASLYCSNAMFQNQIPDGKGIALVVTQAEIKGSVMLRGAKFKAAGTVLFDGTKVGGDFGCSNATFSARTDDGEGAALSLVGAQIGGSISLNDGFNAEGKVNLAGARISGTLDCSGARFQNRTKDGAGFALVIANAYIGGDLFLGGIGFRASGAVTISGSQIKGDLLASDARFENRFSKIEDVFALTALNTEVDRDILFNRSVFVGEVSMWGLHIGRNLDMTGATFLSSKFAVAAPHLHVAGDIFFEETRVIGNMVLSHAEVSGDLKWSGLRFIREYKHDEETLQRQDNSLFDLRNAHIRSALLGADLNSEVNLYIDLCDAHVATLEDDWPGGWGGDAVKNGLISLNLDGFVYDRLSFPHPEPRLSDYFPRWLGKILAIILAAPVILSSNLAESFKANAEEGRTSRIARLFAWCHRSAVAVLRPVFRLINKAGLLEARKPQLSSARLGWLRLQGDGERETSQFRPQPYRHLTRVLQRQGSAEAARQIGIAEGWDAPAEPWYRPVRAMFGVGFGFGLSPILALRSLIIVFLVGWLGVRTSLRKGTMSVTANPVASVFVMDGGKPEVAIQNGSSALATTAFTCSDDDIDPALYTIDVMLPVISLHQETACDFKPRFRSLRVAKFVYSAFGKLAVALALITFSGVLKIRSEE